MTLKNTAILIAAAVLITAVVMWIYFKPAQAEPIKWAGEIEAVNKQIAVEVPVGFQRLHWDHQGMGKGAMLYQSDFTMLFGVNFPTGWKFNAEKDANGHVSILIPKLSLLNEIKVEWEDQSAASICNKASGSRLLRMNTAMKTKAHALFLAKSNDYLAKSENIYELSRRSLEKSYLQFLNGVNPESPATGVTVKFEGEPTFGG